MTATLHFTNDWMRFVLVGFIAWVCLLLLAAVWWSWLMERRSASPRGHFDPPPLQRGVEVTTVPSGIEPGIVWCHWCGMRGRKPRAYSAIATDLDVETLVKDGLAHFTRKDAGAS